MTEHPDPGGESAARAAQLAAMALSVGEAVARLNSQRANNRADDDRRTEAAMRATARVEAARDAVQYREALSPAWLRQQDTGQLLDVWHAAVPHLDNDPVARQAAERIEERMRRLHPEAMAVFDSAVDLPREHRVAQSCHLLRGPYGLDPVGTPPETPLWTADPASHRPPDVVQQAYPVNIRDAMRTAPDATRRAVLAITAGPTRKQLTPTPHISRSTR